MFETWKLMDFAPGEGREKEVFQPGYNDQDWLSVNVPGDVHRALMAAGRIPDPFYDRNEAEVAWMEQREFWYRIKFKATGGAPAADERVLLTFHGLDTYAVIYLNGGLLGRSQNMFNEAVFDVSSKLKWGQENTLAVRFDPPLSKLDPNSPFKSWGRNPERVFMRKAQFGYGWDWGPRLPTIGMWRPVELTRHKIGALLGTHFATLRIDNQNEPFKSPTPTSALVMVRIEAARFAGDTAAGDMPIKAEIRLSAPGDKKPLLDETILLDQPGSFKDQTAYFNLPNPKLWWPLGYGEPFLYDLRVTLRKGKEVLDIKTHQVGIRTLTLDQSPDPDEPGTRFFRFVVNGVPVFAKGANWIPADSFVGAISDAQYAHLLRMARDANMNMLRVWGGGIYEHDIFYELCDQLGILVWQDFMFACAMYPEDSPHFNASVDAEARYQIRRLRSHPSLALWCGNNENQWIHDRNNPEHPEEKVPGTLFYEHVLPEAVKALDGITPYWLSSPYGGNDYNSMEDGDRHNWWVWHGGAPRRFGEPVINDRSPEGVSYRHYAEDSGRFISEFGMHAAPVFETLRRVIPEDQRFHHSPAMDWHNKDNPKNKGDNLIQTVTGLPENLEDYIDFSMIAQAEGLKFGIEHFRRRMPHCSGTLIWQLNDCWPVLSWSLIDYYGFGKAGYFYTGRVYAPVLASFKEEPGGEVSLWVTNDQLSAFEDTFTVRLARFSGETLWEKEVKIELPANSSSPVARFTAQELSGAAGDAAANHYLSVKSEAGKIHWNRHFFVPIKDLQRAVVKPEVHFRQISPHEIEVDLSAPGYVYFFHLTHPSEFTHYMDNYFDLEAGEKLTLRVWNEQVEIKPEEFETGCR